LALTGERIGAADAIYAGVADAFVPKGALPALAADLAAGADGAAEAIRRHARDPEPAQLAARRAEIDRLFAGDDMEAIMARLAEAESDFARKTLEALGQKSPTSLKVTLAAQRRGRALPSLAACLDMEYRVVLRFFASAELHEGIRAAVVNKDRKPLWNPPSLEDVTDEMVADFFAPLGDGELGLAGAEGGERNADKGRKAQ
jgi:enoyl-CoA hydratase